MAHVEEHCSYQRIESLCSEYMFLDDSACNLASLNLLMNSVRPRSGQFDVEAYRHAVDTIIAGAGNHQGQRRVSHRQKSRKIPTISARWV